LWNKTKISCTSWVEFRRVKSKSRGGSMKNIVLLFFTLLVSPLAHAFRDQSVQQVQWLVVGAGPAGIATIGVLHDLGVPYELIAWVDPDFNVGRVGEFYGTVPANNNNKQFIDFVNACATFKECQGEAVEKLRHEDPASFAELNIMIPALRELSAYLRTKLISYQGWLQDLHFSGQTWCSVVNDRKIHANYVVLATGSHPRELNYKDVSVIPLDHALDKNTLSSYIDKNNTIGVIGGSHSAILILKYLYELEVKKIINFYRSPIVYTVDMGTWSLNAIAGLKGTVAKWAREVLEGPTPPKNIYRIYNDGAALEKYLPECNKIVYAVGFEPNDTPLTSEHQPVTYNDANGIIAPRLFGIGIAFPEIYVDPSNGTIDHRVGLKSFMDYAQRLIPQWVHGLGSNLEERTRLAKQKCILEQFADLFAIDLL